MTSANTRNGGPAWGAAETVRILLRGAGQVMFQNSAAAGLLFLAGIFWGAYASGTPAVAWGAVMGLVVSTLTGRLLRLPDDDGRQGLWGFNGILVGCALPTFVEPTAWMWVALVLCSALTVWVRTGLNRVMAPWRVNSFTFPFVLCTWIFLLAARAMHGIPPAHMSAPTLHESFSTLIDPSFGRLAEGWLKGISQVFLIDSWVTGLLFLAGLAAGSVRAALWAALGSALGMAVAALFGASGESIAGGMYGFSPVLTAIALATVFYKRSVRSAVWALLGTAVTVFVQAGMNTAMAPLGIATLTAPFCVATWLFLLPLIRFDDRDKPDHSQLNGENAPRHAAADSSPHAKSE